MTSRQSKKRKENKKTELQRHEELETQLQKMEEERNTELLKLEQQYEAELQKRKQQDKAELQLRQQENDAYIKMIETKLFLQEKLLVIAEHLHELDKKQFDLYTERVKMNNEIQHNIETTPSVPPPELYGLYDNLVLEQMTHNSDELSEIISSQMYNSPWNRPPQVILDTRALF